MLQFAEYIERDRCDEAAEREKVVTQGALLEEAGMPAMNYISRTRSSQAMAALR